MFTVKKVPKVVVISPWGIEQVRGRKINWFCRAVVLAARRVGSPKRGGFLWLGRACPECSATLKRDKFRVFVGKSEVGTPIIDGSIWHCHCGYEYAHYQYRVLPIGDIF